MLCDCIEEGKEKCAKYWDMDELKSIEKFYITKRTETVAIDKGLYSRELKIINKKENSEKNIDQIQFIQWDDHEGISGAYFEKIIKIINMIDISKKESSNTPVVVHCSAGVGRTGTFICMYNLYHEIMEQIVDKEQKEIKFSIMNLVRKIKELRRCSVENENQYNVLFLFAKYILNENNE